MHACRASAAAWRAAADPHRCPTPCPTPSGHSHSVRAPCSSAAAIQCCLAANLANLNLPAHFRPAHPSPGRKRARLDAAAQARARPASTSAWHPAVRHLYVALAAAASPYSTELGLLPLPLYWRVAPPLRFLNCASSRRALRIAASASSSAASASIAACGPDKIPTLQCEVSACIRRARDRVHTRWG